MEINTSKDDLIVNTAISNKSMNSEPDHNVNIKEFSRRETLSFKSKVCLYFKKNKKDLDIIKQNKEFKDNSVSTTKYNFITWLPKSLFMQFFRLANLYFLIISILSFFPFSPKEPISMSGTLLFVLLLVMIKEAYEDCKRYQSDSFLNNTKTHRFEEGSWNEVSWGKLHVGDIVMIKRDEVIPADLLILESSTDTGLCFVDTKNLDGETNLKEKYTHKILKEQLQFKAAEEETTTQHNHVSFYKKHSTEQLGNYHHELYSNFEGKIICDKPNEYLDSWEGSLFIQTMGNLQVSVNIKNLLLRGSDLKNTEFAICLVVYTGHLTKIMKNAKNPPIKVSNVMVIMNRILLTVFVCHFLIVVIFTGLNLSFQLKNRQFISAYVPNYVSNCYLQAI